MRPFLTVLAAPLAASALDLCVPLSSSSDAAISQPSLRGSSCCAAGAAVVCEQGGDSNGIVIGGFGAVASRKRVGTKETGRTTSIPAREIVFGAGNGTGAVLRGSVTPEPLQGKYYVARNMGANVNERHSSGLQINGMLSLVEYPSSTPGRHRGVMGQLNFVDPHTSAVCQIRQFVATEGLPGHFPSSSCSGVCDAGGRKCSPFRLCAVASGARGEYWVAAVIGSTLYHLVLLSAGAGLPMNTISVQTAADCDATSANSGMISSTVSIEANPSSGSYAVVARNTLATPLGGTGLNPPFLAPPFVIARF